MVIQNYLGLHFMNEPQKEKRPAALVFIFITLLIDVIGLAIIIPVLP